VTTIQIDDAIYLDALQYVWGLEGKPRGWGGAFSDWIKHREPTINSERRDDLESLFASIVGHYSGGSYDSTLPWDDDRTLCWSFFRAWLDRDEMSDKPSDQGQPLA
jgi:hypothetical protein